LLKKPLQVGILKTEKWAINGTLVSGCQRFPLEDKVNALMRVYTPFNFMLSTSRREALD
jgi:hypothetical protein